MNLEESKNNEYDMQEKIKKLEVLLHEERFAIIRALILNESNYN